MPGIKLKKRLLRPRFLIPLLIFILFFSLICLKIYGHFDGFYILRENSFSIRITDDVILGDEDKVLWGVYLRTVGSNIHKKGIRSKYSVS